MNKLSLHSVAELSLAELVLAHNRTFAGYATPVAETVESFSARCRQLSVDLSDSLMLLDEDGAVAALTLLSIRGSRGWCSTFAVAPEFRRQGVGRMLITALIRQARRIGLVQLQLEVLTQNRAAIGLYQKAGFQTTRSVVSLAADITQMLPLLPINDPVSYIIRETEISTALHAGSLLGGLALCWQREPATIYTLNELNALVAYRKGAPEAALIYRDNAAAEQIALMVFAFREEAAMLALLGRAVRTSPKLPDGRKTEQFWISNEPEDAPTLGLLGHLGFRDKLRKHEMTISLI